MLHDLQFPPNPPTFNLTRFPAEEFYDKSLPVTSKSSFMKLSVKSFLLLFPLFALVSSCVSTARFDQYAYAQTTSAKVEALDLLSNATQNAGDFGDRIKEMDLKLQKIYEYEKNRPKNGITTKMWELMLDPDKRLYGGFVKRWKAESKLSATFVGEASKLIASGFDKIAELESNKIPKNEEAIKPFQ